ncbi:MAG: GspE/PulE family protein [Victivallaceae bacterium]|nr:GspE/PulE family protein [Victivallaceae bacterium]
MPYDPIKILILAVWIFSGAYALNAAAAVNCRPRLRGWFDLIALLAGPVVIAILFCRSWLIENFSGVFGKNGEIKRDFDIEIFDSRGQKVLDMADADETGHDSIYITRKLIFDALSKRASDIFLDPKPGEVIQVRYRIDGALRKVMDISGDIGGSVISSIKVSAGMDITEKRRPQDGAFSARTAKGSASFRVASVGAFGGEKIAVRVLASSAGPMTLRDTGVDPDSLRTLLNAIKVPSGMILICGPTGSGKTSTLYALLKEIDYSMKNVISIEDPIEHVVEEISQMEVNNRADITFAKLLRNALRQNPDVICLGEIRDDETAQIAVNAAQTGHLIIATVHSNDNIGTIDRLMNLGVPLRSLAATLQLIVSQRLVRRLCPACRRRVAMSADFVDYFHRAGLDPDGVCEPVGCRECDGTGFSGRVALFDLLVMNNSFRSLLESDSATLSSIKEGIDVEHGASALAYEGYKLVAAGVTSLAEVQRVTMDLEQ